ncbi:MAG: alpha/beta hydrolase [Solirubrobacteraceae bacterium]
MNEQFATVNTDITLCYEEFGDRTDPTVLLVMGLATQMLAWDERFCQQLVERGFHVVRFDNRDVGRSTKIATPPTRPPTLKQMALRDRRAAAYTLSDMADDAVALLDHLDVRRAHVVGASMGGMIAQTIAIEYPERVLSLVSIMSNEGGRLKGQPQLTVYPVLLRRAPDDREAYAAHAVGVLKLIGSPDFPFDEAAVKERARIGFDRGISAAGAGRQLMAVLASPNRTAGLRRLRVPTAVIHGTKDRLVSKSGGRAVAAAVPEATLLEIHGMGHDLPPGTWPRIVDAIATNAARAFSDSPTTSQR